MDVEVDRSRPRGKVLPPVYFGVSILAMVGLRFLLSGPQVIGSPWRYLGLLPLGLGAGLNVVADRLFKKYKTEVKPFRDSSALVTEGPYRFSRHPMYLGGILMLLGIGVLLGTAVPFVVVPVMFWITTLRFVVPEEAAMERQFGERYLDYKRRVRRWI